MTVHCVRRVNSMEFNGIRKYRGQAFVFAHASTLSLHTVRVSKHLEKIFIFIVFER